ncbi:MAG: DUF1565 domain-containing protein [Candidatus Bathyarchaeota archaeon]|nr:DUF1565 domain-containing protein [Candidatus Bathyarchaeota archaeon]
MAAIVAVIILSVIVLVQSSTMNEQPKTIVVPDDYPTIQSAVGNASAGDTVFVKKGTYEVHSYADAINVDKPINLIGEDSKRTTINGHRSDDGSYPLPYDRGTIAISSSNVTVAGFSITNSFYAITIRLKAVEIRISNNIISDSTRGIITEHLIEDSEISKNVIINSTFGINGYFRNSIISNNTLSGNRAAITAHGSYNACNLTIENNFINNNQIGINLQSISNVDVYGNAIAQNMGFNRKGYGIELSYVNNSAIHNNLIEKNDVGVYLPNYLLRYGQGSGNRVYGNNFIDNGYAVEVEHQYPFPEAYEHMQAESDTSTLNGTDAVTWYNGAVGNYWSDYTGKGSYIIDENNIDYHPLTQPADISSETSASNFALTDSWMQPLIIVAVIIALVIVSLLVCRQHRKTAFGS